MLVWGALHTAAFAPLGWWPLQWLCLAALARVVLASGVREAAWQAGSFSLGWMASGLWWLYISLHDFGGLSPPLSVLAVLLLSAYLSAYLALGMALFALLRRRFFGELPAPTAWQRLGLGLLWGGCWLGAELARGQWLTGFPWLAAGYAHTDGPLAALAPWLGVYGLGLVSALLAVALADLWPVAGAANQGAAPAQRWRRPAGLQGLALALLLVAALAPVEFTQPSGKLQISLLQPNVAQDLKFDPAHIGETMAAVLEQVQAARGTLVLTPESVLPVPKAYLDESYWAALVQPFVQPNEQPNVQPSVQAPSRSAARGLAQPPGRAALIGTFLGDDTQGYVNSMVGVSAADPAGNYHYGKRHLLPVGEYMPAGLRWFVALLDIPLGEQAAGSSEALFEAGGQRIRPLICYEDLFGEEFAASTVGPEAATVLANASNLAWFGKLMMQDQHLQVSRMRSLELQRPLVRATNTGATAAIDHQGQVIARLPGWEVGTLDVEVQGRIGSTPYARWVAAWGLWPAWGLALALALLACRLARRPGRSA